MSANVTGFVLTFNGERYIEKTLNSLDFCDQLLVIDSGSSDRTLEIAAASGARIIERSWPGFIEQHRFALSQVSTDWAITLDQDEYLSLRLKASVRQALEDPGTLAGFYCSRRSFYYDRFMKHSGWYPDYLLRVFHRDRVILGGRPPHEEYSPRGETKKLSGDIIHFPYDSLSEHLIKINLYTQTAARALHEQGKHGGLFAGMGHGLANFCKHYLFRRGFLDGRAGFLLAVQAFYYSLHKYVRIQELEIQEKRDGSQGNSQDH